MASFKEFLKRKDIVITPQRYLIEALGAMAQGLFASLLIGTIIKTLGQQTGLDVLVDLGGYATAMSGPAMACAIGWALHCPPLVLFSLITVGYSANALGGAGGPLAVLIIAIVAAELGKAVSKETRSTSSPPRWSRSLQASACPCSSQRPSARRQVRWAPSSCGPPSRPRWSWASSCRSSWAWR